MQCMSRTTKHEANSMVVRNKREKPIRKCQKRDKSSNGRGRKLTEKWQYILELNQVRPQK